MTNGWKRRARIIALAGATWSVAVMAAPAAPDAIYVNGRVFTADAKDKVVDGFAVTGDSFVAVGTTAEMRKLAGPRTRVVDLKGAFVSPGLTDDHFHNEGGGPDVDLSHARSLDQLLTIVANAAAAAPAGAIIVSNSDWHEAQLKEQRLPTAQEIDRVVPDKPVVLVRGGHSYILNTAALRKWNITKQTPVPAGGAISRDEKGELTGELFDNAKPLVTLPPEAPVSMADLMKTQKAVNAYGITAVRIPGAYKGDLKAAYGLMQQAAREKTLTLRYTVYLPGFTLRTAADVEPMLTRWQVKQDEGDDWVRIGGVKLIVDGGFEGGHLSRPYQEPYGKGGTYAGVVVTDPAPYTGIVRELSRRGWRPATHAVGDAGIDQVLDAYEAVNKESPIATKRWAIEHAFVANPELIARMKAMNVAVSAQDHLYLAAPALKKYWGKEVAEQVTPLKAYLDAGLLVAAGTDAPVIPFNPFWGLYHFMSRETISDGVYGSNQKVVSRATLLRLVTINYARLIGEEARKGSIEPGKLADFAVLTDNFLTAAPERVRDMKARATYVGGKQVYSDGSL